jgi:hypothetical protein
VWLLLDELHRARPIRCPHKALEEKNRFANLISNLDSQIKRIPLEELASLVSILFPAASKGTSTGVTGSVALARAGG